MSTIPVEHIHVEAEQKDGPTKSERPLVARHRYLIIGGTILLVALLGGFVPRISRSKIAAADSQQLSETTVAVVSPTMQAPPDGILLPAEVRPWQEASIYSRVNGYLKSWLVDIGAHVEQDQLLAEIDTPDLDHQLEQARGQSAQADANYALAKSTNQKYQQLWKEGVVSQLDSENAANGEASNKANSEAFAAQVRVLEQDVAFKRVTAPFAGTITTRNTNVGDLIVANNTAMELFHIEQTNPLRIYFRVPQGNAADFREGQMLDIVFPEPLNRTLQAQVATTSESIMPTSRTLLVELHLDNPDNQIPAGAYAQARLRADSLGKMLILPNTTLLFRAQGLQVGLVKPDNTVELRDIKVGRDFGTKIQITAGLNPDDKVIANPSDSLVSGTKVRVAARTQGTP